MTTDNEPAKIKVGDTIVHDLVPDFPMKVLEVLPCDPDQHPGEETFDPDHSAFRIVDPEGNEDWLCAHNVRRARS